jgi:hypothetical protein
MAATRLPSPMPLQPPAIRLQLAPLPANTLPQVASLGSMHPLAAPLPANTRPLVVPLPGSTRPLAAPRPAGSVRPCRPCSR